MKIKTKTLDYDRVAAMPAPRHRVPGRPNPLLHTLVRVLSIPELMKPHFTCTTEYMEAAGKGPWLVLMNHSSFIDLKIAFKLLYPKPFSIVCTADSFVGKNLQMRQLGCIPTNKFVADIICIGDNHSLCCFPHEKDVVAFAGAARRREKNTAYISQGLPQMRQPC